MRTVLPWLHKLKAADLSKLAVSLGSPCSGTKAVQVKGIERVLAALPSSSDTGSGVKKNENGRISVVSIDMGIRNLAYSHWTAEVAPNTEAETRGVLRYKIPVLRAWRKIDVSSTASANPETTGDNETLGTSKATAKLRAMKESFEPVDYADRAYEFVRTMLAEHDPSHVLIERQRFRTGGNSAVQEWTIRVGVFEGMLYAVLRSLVNANDRYRGLVVEPVLPARVNRFWLEGSMRGKPGSDGEEVSKKTAREVKQMKISLVKDLLAASRRRTDNRMFEVETDLERMVSAFVGKGSKGGKKVNASASNTGETTEDLGFSKLDDLSDCFLQGLAWLQWYNNRVQIDVLGEEAFPMAA